MTLTAVPTTRERALGALTGLALGDSLGMPTQSMSPEQIRTHYGHVTGLLDAASAQPIAPGMAAGSVTDDTEQALLLGKLLVEGHGHVDPHHFANTLLAWEDDMRARGSRDLLGPSTKLALERVRDGADPTVTGRLGTTNGAAMRVTPVGIAFSLRNPDRFTEAIHESCMVTHDTRQGLEAATLIAASVSAAIDGSSATEATREALRIARESPARGHWSAKASVVARAELALRMTEELHGEELADYLRTVVGTSVESSESVSCALVIIREFADSPLEGLCFAASLGGDTDTIAAMAGAVLGAASPKLLPNDLVTEVLTQSNLELGTLCDGLLAIRREE